MNKVIKALILGTLLGAVTACSGGGGGGGGGGGSASPSELTISGTLGSTGFMNNKVSAQGENGKFGLSLSDLEIAVIAWSNPPVAASASVGTDGSFSVTLSGVTSAPISAVFRSKTNPEEKVGVVTFVDSNIKDLSGNTKEMGTLSLKGAVQLGNINISEGKVVVNVATIATSNDTSTSVSGYDFSGEWAAAAFSAKPTGFLTAGDSCEDNDPNGEPCIAVGQKISLLKIVGKAFTKNGTCTDTACDPTTGGTVDSNTDKYGISIWQGPASGAGSAVQACGYKTGFTAHSARFGAGIHIPTAPSIGGNNMTLANFTFSSLAPTENSSNNDNQPWMTANAKAQYELGDCSSTSKNSIDLFVCKGKAQIDATPNQVVYMVGANGSDYGCINDATQKPVNVSKWDNTPDNGTCTQEAVSGFTGLSKSTCHYTNQDPDGSGDLPAMNYTCTHAGGTFTDANLTTPVTGALSNMQNDVLLAANADCDSLSYDKTQASDDYKRLAVYRCYSQSYDGHDDGGGACVQRYRFNWAATTPANFVMTDGNGKPNTNFLTDILTYSADGNSFFVDSFNEETVAISAGANGAMDFCRVAINTKMTGKKVSDSQQMFTIMESEHLIDNQKATCLAAANGPDTWENGNLSYRVKKDLKLVFYLNK